MATPLYKKMKKRGTSFYSFPNAIQDLNKVKMNDNYKMSFSKYALLNIPEQVISGVTGIDRDQTLGKLNFDKDDNGPLFYNFQPGQNSELPTLFSDQLVESLRNYVANYDTTLRESRINTNNDFYNVNELTTPTEMIFWKWCRKLNLLDLEPAEHMIDWDKNLDDFKNNNGIDNSYFQKYLWKEREVKEYDCSVNGSTITINEFAKFRKDDYINISGDTTDYLISNVINNTTNTIITLSTSTGLPLTNTTMKLKYHRLIECVGDVQAISQVQTSRYNFTEVSIQIPHHAGATPTILFDITDNSNYYPGLEMPILPQEQQDEIFGSENTNSPIRIHPENYPGTYFGYFDTKDKTYKCSFGDKNRKNGDYYGITKSSNNNFDVPDFKENLSDFDSKHIDGLKLDFDSNHYLKMNLPEYLIKNFDEFNSAYFDEAPRDYVFNAILWYYDLEDGSGKITSNLFGIEFLNNPNDDGDDCDVDSNLITPYRKLVSNGDQDGYSYIFDFDLNQEVDNDSIPMSYDPTTINNQYSFDLYKNILQSNALLYDSFMNIVSGYTDIQDDLYDLRSIMMSDTDINKIKNQIENLNDLLTLYSTMQIVDSDTIIVETLYNGAYPTLKLNMVNTEYNDIQNINIIDIYKYQDSNSGSTYTIPVQQSKKTQLNIYNNNNTFITDAKVILSQDLKYMQSMEVLVLPNMSETTTKLNIDIKFNENGVIKNTSLIKDIITPPDLLFYDVNTPDNSTFSSSFFIHENIHIFSKQISYINNKTNISFLLTYTDNIFEINEYVYIENFFLDNGTNIIDMSGAFKIINTSSSGIEIDLNTFNMTLKGMLKISYYKGIKYTILRVNSSNTSTLEDRYKITKELI